MAYLDKLRVTFRSATGRRANLELLVAPATTQGQITALLAALAGVSRGAIAHATREVSVAAVNAAVGTSGPYETHRDVLCLRLGHGDGTMSEPKIPCVLETVLLEDGSARRSDGCRRRRGNGIPGCGLATGLARLHPKLVTRMPQGAGATGAPLYQRRTGWMRHGS